MNAFEVNKIAGAILGALLFAAGSGFVAELLYHPRPAGKAGYDLPEPEPETAAAPAEAAKVEPIAVRLASANVEKGQAGTKACHACHSFEKGGPNKVGPDLWDVVDRHKGGHAGFDYSAGLKEKGGDWTYADLDAFLTNPKGYVKGTKMAFAGIASPQERANVIAYLRTLSDNPKPLPAVEKTEEKPAAQPAAQPSAPAAGAGDAKPTANQPAAAKPSEGKDSPAKPADTSTAKPGPAKAPGSPRPSGEPNDQNAPAPPADANASDQQGTPSSLIPAEPTAPSSPAAVEPPAQANPEAVERAKELDVTVPQPQAPQDGNAPKP
ncbi:c-type cytochrome [Methylobacterium sp. NEAU 140]|uniref:c-type cytochrome n=1 Tax=Methylobacterium sp. NEAU 140 TaxID=3064945 RepID=UPI0027376165|nr:c-type cytochrome [Methylobacterium sp. NEAU 140]MDP4021707.1 c-type cytochrome [Methylobacterium sp. NEAU 140]